MRRLRARRAMEVLTVLCVALALGIGASQLLTEGLDQFLFRPAGVGASPSKAAPDEVAAVPPPPKPAVLVPPAIPRVQPMAHDRDRHARSRR
jgi:hypothetical protein